MTVYSHAIHNQTYVSKKRSIATPLKRPRLFALNMVLLTGLLAVMGGRMVLANIVTRQTYQLTSLAKQYKSASVTVAEHSSESGRSADVDSLLRFVKKSGMVENKDAVVLKSNAGVAYDFEKAGQN